MSKATDPNNNWKYGGRFWRVPIPGNLVVYPFRSLFGSSTVPSADFYTQSFSSNQDLTFSQQGTELADVISAVLLANPTKNKVILVAHSMGGLAARAYLQSQLGLTRNDVEALITVGTPHRGSWEAQHCVDIRLLCLLPGIRADSIAIKDLRPDSSALAGLNTTISLPTDVSRYVSIVARWEKGNTLTNVSPYEWGEGGDGIVTASSQDFAQVPGFAESAKHSVVPIEFAVNPGCGHQASIINEVHTCETHDTTVQYVIRQSILGKSIADVSPAMVTTDRAFVNAASTQPQIVVPSHTYHPRGVTNPHLWFGTTQKTSVAAAKSSPELGSLQIAQQTSTSTPGVQKFYLSLPGPLVPGQTYYYQFVAEADGYTTFGQVHEVTIPPGIGALLPAPAGLSPATGAINQSLTPTLTWNPVANATSYRIMLAQNPDALPTDPTDGSCDRCLLETVVDTTATYSPPTGLLAPGTTYYWQVHARSPTNFGAWRSLDNSGAWTAASIFTTAMPTSVTLLPAPTPNAPANADTGLSTTPTMSWTPAAGAASYRIMIATNPNSLTSDPTSANCPACVVNAIVSGGTSTTYVPDLGILATGTTYYWSIKARGANNYGAWSPVRSFSTSALVPSPSGTVTEFSAGITSNAWPYAITTGPDGNVWFTELGIARVTPTGLITVFSNGISNGWISAITVGPDGNLWFTNNQSNRIGRITPTGVVTEFSAGISGGVGNYAFANAGLYDITAGPDGNLWFTEYLGNRIGRITPTGVVTEFSAGISPGAYPRSITAGPDGNLWFTEWSGRIGRITPAGVVTEFSDGIIGDTYGITAGPDGNLWFTQANANKIGRITPAGVVTNFSAGISVGAYVQHITAGPDGNLWFTEANTNRIGRITTTGVITEFSAGNSANAAPQDIAAGPDGNLWFTEQYSGRVGRISPGPERWYTLNVSSVNGTVTSVPAGINCGGDCSASLALGTNVTLTAIPNAGSNFHGWSGGGCSGTGVCQVTMNGATTVSATFSTNTPPDAPIISLS